ncbi:unnamed protein product [Cyclocybe aegerita]|uniref:Uncharacterized protein n=1 Tax=Cyclocybe aegerita TaxID=1973307 RepID=A0A8S0X502_CYCAE|nr:unnamed protein product [Cyclocybe aegerita]
MGRFALVNKGWISRFAAFLLWSAFILIYVGAVADSFNVDMCYSSAMDNFKPSSHSFKCKITYVRPLPSVLRHSSPVFASAFEDRYFSTIHLRYRIPSALREKISALWSTTRGAQTANLRFHLVRLTGFAAFVASAVVREDGWGRLGDQILLAVKTNS